MKLIKKNEIFMSASVTISIMTTCFKETHSVALELDNYIIYMVLKNICCSQPGMIILTCICETHSLVYLF